MNAYGATMGKDWGSAGPALVRTLLSEALPGLLPDQIKWCVNLLPATTSLENAIRHFSAYVDFDVADRLPEVRRPDSCAALSALPCDAPPTGASHCHVNAESQLGEPRIGDLIPLPGEPAWPVFLSAIERFLSEAPGPAVAF